jgi:hypothetical protein
MGGGDALVVLAHRDRLRRLKEPARPVGQFLKIHGFPSILRRCGVLAAQHKT